MLIVRPGQNRAVSDIGPVLSEHLPVCQPFLGSLPGHAYLHHSLQCPILVLPGGHCHSAFASRPWLTKENFCRGTPPMCTHMQPPPTTLSLCTNFQPPHNALPACSHGCHQATTGMRTQGPHSTTADMHLQTALRCCLVTVSICTCAEFTVLLPSHHWHMRGPCCHQHPDKALCWHSPTECCSQQTG